MDIIYGNFNAEVIKAIKEALESNQVNPLYIYGTSGTGKSFLVSKMAEEYRGTSLLIKSKEFQPAQLNEYLDYDLLILEDIQLLPTRSPVPETLFEITSYFKELDKQIVYTADCPPSLLDISDRIISRIEAGVIVKINRFDKKSKRKVLNVLGKGFPSETINKLIDKDIHTISQAIGAIKKTKLFGYVTPDEPEKETSSREKKRIRGEFDQFINEVKEDIPETLGGTEREESLRDEYRSKMYVWKMKGFNVERIKRVIDGPIEKITSEFVSFTMDIQRLIELQRRYGILEIDALFDTSVLTHNESKEIEEALFDPERVEWLTNKIDEFEKIQESLSTTDHETMQPPAEEFDTKKTNQVNIENLINEISLELKDNSFRLIEEY